MSVLLKDMSDSERGETLRRLVMSSAKRVREDVYEPVYGQEGVDVGFEDFADLTVTAGYIEQASADVRKVWQNLIRYLREAEGGQETASLCEGVRFCYSDLEEFSSGLSKKNAGGVMEIAEALRLRILKNLSFELLFYTCETYEEGEKLFRELMMVPGFRERHLHPAMFNEWLYACETLEEKLRVVGFMRELGIAPNIGSCIGLLVGITDNKKYWDTYARLAGVPELKAVLVSSDFMMESLRHCRLYTQGRFLFNIVKHYRIPVVEEFWTEWLGLCTNVDDGMKVLGCAKELLKDYRRVPMVVWKRILELTRKSSMSEVSMLKIKGKHSSKKVDDFVAIVSFMGVNGVNFDVSVLDDLDMPPYVALKMKERMADFPEGGDDIDKLYDVFVENGGRGDAGGLGRVFLGVYGFVCKRALLAMEYEYILECRNLELFMAMVGRMFDEGGDKNEEFRELVARLDLPFGMCVVLERRLREFFAGKGVDVEDFYYSRRAGFDVVEGEWCVDLYGYVREKARVDKAEYFTGLMGFMWKEGIDLDQRFIDEFAASGVDGAAVKIFLDGLFAQKEAGGNWKIFYVWLERVVAEKLKGGEKRKTVDGFVELFSGWLGGAGDGGGGDGASGGAGGAEVDYSAVFESEFDFSGGQTGKAVKRVDDLLRERGLNADLSGSGLPLGLVEFWRGLREVASSARTARRQKKKNGEKRPDGKPL